MNKQEDLIFLSFSETAAVNYPNNDYILSFEGKFGKLFMLIEGLGLNGGGDIASQLVAITVKEHFVNLPANFQVQENLKTAIYKANKAVIEYAISHHFMTGLGSSFALVFIKNNRYWISTLGDTRIYRILGKNIENLAEKYNRQNSLLKNNEDLQLIGVPNLIINISGPFDLIENEFLAVTSNSFSRHITRYELKQAVDYLAFDKLQKYFTELAFKRSLKDSFTFIGIKALRGKKEEKPDELILAENKKFYFSLALFFCALILFLHTFSPLLFNSVNIFRKEQRVPAFQELFQPEQIK